MRLTLDAATGSAGLGVLPGPQVQVGTEPDYYSPTKDRRATFGVPRFTSSSKPRNARNCTESYTLQDKVQAGTDTSKGGHWQLVLT